MSTLNNSGIRGLGVHDAAVNPAIWLLAPPSRPSLILPSGTSDLFRRGEAAESEPARAQPAPPELANDDFPFSALIRLVRQMRK